MSKRKNTSSRRRDARQEAQSIDFTICSRPAVRNNITGTFPDSPSNKNPTQTAAACSNGAKIKTKLIDEVDGTAGCENGSTPLHVAVRLRESVTLIKSLALDSVINTPDAAGRTALHLAAFYGYDDIVNLLLDKDADATRVDHSNSTPLHAAAQIGHVDIARSLLQHGASVDSRDENDVTPLMTAVWMNHMPMVRCLVTNGAWIDRRLACSSTLLHRTLRPLNTERVLQILLDEEDIHSPFRQVCNQDHDVSDVHAFSYGRELHEFTAIGILQATPVHLAALCGCYDVLKHLIGGYIDVRSKHGETPLHCAVTMGHLQLVQLLISNGADVNAKTSTYGCTPLHMACYLGHKSIVTELLEHSADIDVKDLEGRSPLDAAYLGGQQEVLSILRRRAASKNRRVRKMRILSPWQWKTGDKSHSSR